VLLAVLGWRPGCRLGNVGSESACSR